MFLRACGVTERFEGSLIVINTVSKEAKRRSTLYLVKQALEILYFKLFSFFEFVCSSSSLQWVSFVNKNLQKYLHQSEIVFLITVHLLNT